MPSTEAARYVIGVDVGTGSARAGVFDAQGELVASAKRDLELITAPDDIAEYESEGIWRAVTAAVAAAIREAAIAPDAVAGIGFDATCSLVVVGAGGKALPVGDPERPERNVIAWLDHRAIEEARFINATGHAVLDYVGGTISPEMETPKLLWLKRHRPSTYAGAWQFFDLTDYLTWRATGSTARSLCTLTCKWTYIAHEQRWDPSYFRAIGLDDLSDEGFARIGTEVVAPGTALGNGLAPDAAAAMGLPAGIPVAAGLIDAHAGGIATVGASGGDDPLTSRMAYVFGTSACTMVSADRPVRVDGVWGPYLSAMLPGLWLNEGGQSAAGAAIDHLIRLHPFRDLDSLPGEGAGDKLARLVAARVSSASEAAYLADGLHVVPDFLGNRAPFADPGARAVIAGLDLDASLQGLTALYVAGLCGIGYGARQIVAACAERGIGPRSIVVSGGAARSDLIRQLIADTTRLEVMSVKSDEPVLLGAAMLGAVAGGLHPSIETAMPSMSRIDRRYAPVTGPLGDLHEARFRAYETLQAASRSIRATR